jgi:hypothetical protein
MMKNTLILSVDQLATYYRESMLAHLSDTQEDTNPSEFGEDLILLGSTLKGMTSKNNEVALGTFRQEFAAGYTMMMVADKDFVQLEEWSKTDEDFQVVLFREDGSAVGIVKKKDVNW